MCVNRVALTAVDGQVDVAVLRSQDVCGRAAIQAGRLRGHVDDLDGA